MFYQFSSWDCNQYLLQKPVCPLSLRVLSSSLFFAFCKVQLNFRDIATSKVQSLILQIVRSLTDLSVRAVSDQVSERKTTECPNMCVVCTMCQKQSGVVTSVQFKKYFLNFKCHKSSRVFKKCQIWLNFGFLRCFYLYVT